MCSRRGGAFVCQVNNEGLTTNRNRGGSHHGRRRGGFQNFAQQFYKPNESRSDRQWLGGTMTLPSDSTHYEFQVMARLARHSDRSGRLITRSTTRGGVGLLYVCQVSPCGISLPASGFRRCSKVTRPHAWPQQDEDRAAPARPHADGSTRRHVADLRRHCRSATSMNWSRCVRRGTVQGRRR